MSGNYHISISIYGLYGNHHNNRIHQDINMRDVRQLSQKRNSLGYQNVGCTTSITTTGFIRISICGMYGNHHNNGIHQGINMRDVRQSSQQRDSLGYQYVGCTVIITTTGFIRISICGMYGIHYNNGIHKVIDMRDVR